MAKRVLGDDPFSTGEDAEAGAKKASRAPAAAKPSKRPASRAPAAPSARPSKGAPAKKGGSKAVDEVKVPPHAALPREAEAMIAHVAKADEPPEDDARTGVEEAAAQADLPPEILPESMTADAPPWSSLPARDTGEAIEAVSAVPLETQIADVEAQLDTLLHRAAERGGDRETLDRVAERLRARVETETARVSRTPSVPPGPDDAQGFDVARELLSSDFGSRQWGRVALRDRSEEVDDFGRDDAYEKRLRPVFDFLYERWWRVEAHDIDRVPAEGRVVICANHSGAVPYDGAMLATALRREHPARRELRWLAEDFVFHMPFLGVFMNRIGAVRACQENAERLLRKDACVGVFPEGVKGLSKLYRDRYKLQRFGRGGHVKLAMRTRTPLVPVAILGAEEAHPLLAPTGLLAKTLGIPFVPITPTFPWLGPLGLLPLPSRWKMFFLEPIPMDIYGPEAAEDEVLVGRLNEKIRGLIQDQLDRAVRDRVGIFSG